MIIESGIIILLGFVFIVAKMKRKTLLKMLGYPLAVDITGSVVAYVLHWGTFSGVMAAAVAGLMLSALTSLMRWAVGYTRNGVYYPGHMANWAQYA
jgi:hypothetical protein